MTKRAKVLSGLTKKVGQPVGNDARIGKMEGQKSSALVEQYQLIREDLMKLRDDLTKGYDMAREMMDKKTLMSELLKIK